MYLPTALLHRFAQGSCRRGVLASDTGTTSYIQKWLCFPMLPKPMALLSRNMYVMKTENVVQTNAAWRIKWPLQLTLLWFYSARTDGFHFPFFFKKKHTCIVQIRQMLSSYLWQLVVCLQEIVHSPTQKKYEASAP